jgi:hypothetical protein
MRTALAIGTIGAIVLAALFFFTGRMPTAPTGEGTATSTLPKLAYYSPPVPILTLKPARTPPTGFKEFRDEFYKFQLFYPAEMAAHIHKEGGSASTITFTDPNGAGFQLFIVPYGEPAISEARFKKDVPSGVIEQQTTTSIDGMQGVKFYSHNAVMGDTREVWFIGRGFLYEFTTYKELDALAETVLQSWQFL